MSARRRVRFFGRWQLMNRAHFRWVTQQWFDAGYDRCKDDIAAGRATSPEARDRQWHNG